MAVLFAWNERRDQKLTFEDLRLATELPENELKKTLWVSSYYMSNCFDRQVFSSSSYAEHIKGQVFYFIAQFLVPDAHAAVFGSTEREGSTEGVVAPP